MKRREEGKKPSLLRSENQWKSSRKNWARIPKGYQGLEILGIGSIARMRLRQFKKSTKNHNEQRTDMSFSII